MQIVNTIYAIDNMYAIDWAVHQWMSAIVDISQLWDKS